MVTLSLTTPGMLFPAISLLMLAYTNRFLGLATLVRNLASGWRDNPVKSIESQVANLKFRLELLRHAQAFGVLSLFFCTASILVILLEANVLAIVLFAAALALMMISLVYSLTEIYMSVRAIQMELDDIFERR